MEYSAVIARQLFARVIGQVHFGIPVFNAKYLNGPGWSISLNLIGH